MDTKQTHKPTKKRINKNQTIKETNKQTNKQINEQQVSCPIFSKCNKILIHIYLLVMVIKGRYQRDENSCVLECGCQATWLSR